MSLKVNVMVATVGRVLQKLMKKLKNELLWLYFSICENSKKLLNLNYLH